MCMVTRIEWTYRTASGESAGNGAQVGIEIFRDGELIAAMGDGSDSGGQLSRPDSATRVATLATDGYADGALPPTAFAAFPDGVRGHLDVRFTVDGPDAWQIRQIESTVTRREFRRMLESPGACEWREAAERFEFAGVGVLHADPGEGTSILELSY